MLNVIKNMLGIDPDDVCAAEQLFLEEMNDSALRRRIFTDMLKNSEFSYAGSYLVCRDDDIKIFKRVQPEIRTVQEVVDELKKYTGNFIFCVAGCAVISGVEYSHWLAFAVWDNVVYGFCPGISFMNTGMIALVELVIDKVFNRSISWDGGTKKGPQNYTNCIFPTRGNWIPQWLKRQDSFCQTWTVFWLGEWLLDEAFSQSDWGTNPGDLTKKIRTFILYIQRKYRVLPSCYSQILETYYKLF